jgi:protease-4
VWTGAQAHELRLVDRLGTLGDALDVAARQAGFEPSDLYRVRLLPRPQTFAERLAEQFGGVFAGKQSAARAALPLPAQEAANDLERLFRQNGAVQALLPTRLTIR